MMHMYLKICLSLVFLSSVCFASFASTSWERIDPKHWKVVESKRIIAQALNRRPIRCIFALKKHDPATNIKVIRIRFEAVGNTLPEIVEICQGDVIWYPWGQKDLSNLGCWPK